MSLNITVSLLPAEMMLLPPSNPRMIVTVSHQQAMLHLWYQVGHCFGEKLLLIYILVSGHISLQCLSSSYIYIYIWMYERSGCVLNTHHAKLHLGFNKGIVAK